MFTIEYYLEISGKSPFEKWFNSLDIYSKKIVEDRFDRLTIFGHLGDYKNLGDGIFENCKCYTMKTYLRSH